MPKAEKIETVEQYKKLFENSSTVFVTDYQGLNVADLTVLRKKLRENNVKFLVGKNTLFRLAAKETELKGIEPHLDGPTAVVFSAADPAAAAKILYDSFKQHDRPRTKAFWLDNIAYAGDDIQKLAELPSKDQLYSMIAAAVEAPIAELVRSLDAVHRELVGTIDALAEKRKSEG